MDAMTLRRATQADAASLGALHVASWQETYTGILPHEMLAGLSVTAWTAMWNKILSSPDEFGRIAVFIVEDGGRAIGFGSCGKQRDTALTNAGFSGSLARFTCFVRIRVEALVGRLWRRWRGSYLLRGTPLHVCGPCARMLPHEPSMASLAASSWVRRSTSGLMRSSLRMLMAGAMYCLWSAKGKPPGRSTSLLGAYPECPVLVEKSRE